MSDKGSSIASRVIRSSDCALAVSLPLSGEELAACKHNKEHDYAQLLLVKRDHSLESERDILESYERQITPLREACDCAESLSIAVRRNATSEDLRYLLENYPVVLFVSHMRLKDIQKEELVDSALAFQILRSPRNLLQRELQKEVKRVDRGLLQGADDAKLVTPVVTQRLAEALQTIHSGAYRWYFDPSKDGKLEGERLQEQGPDSVLRRMTRLEIEEALTPALLPGACVEFADGMQPIESLVRAIPAATQPDVSTEERILDLSLCNSAVLAPTIKRKRRNCLLRVNRYPAHPLYAALYCRSVLAILAEIPRTYPKAVAATIDALERQCG